MFELYLLIILLLLVLSIVYYSLKLGISPMPSSKRVNIQILKLIQNSKDNTIVDLGSGFGTLAIFLALKLPNKKVIGYELSIVPYLISQLLKYILNIQNLHFYKKDFLQVNLKNKTLVCYLFPKGMEKLENKLIDEDINTTIISSTFAFRNIKSKDVRTSNDLYKTHIYSYRT